MLLLLIKLPRTFFNFIILATTYSPFSLWGLIHSAPIVIPGYKIMAATSYPLSCYQLYRSDHKGLAIPIPFQIDEIDNKGDYILEKGNLKNIGNSDGIFGRYDELTFMGNDVGMPRRPTKWEGEKPDILYEIRFSNRVAKELGGAVFIGIHFKGTMKKTTKKYVVYDKAKASIRTTKYQYRFDKRNYLVTEKVVMYPYRSNDGTMISEATASAPIPLLNSSTFYLKADLKYFLTLEANHRTLDSQLEAYKSGPIRSIIRVKFIYTFLKLNFELGLYTEISFFSNSVILPAVISNPLESENSLNHGSGFYYGFALNRNPKEYTIASNMQTYPPKASLFDFFKSAKKHHKKFWISLIGTDHMFYLELRPSAKMIKAGNIPYLYKQEVDGKVLAKLDNDTPNSLGKSPVNIGLYFDLTKFYQGDQMMAFQLFMENKKDLDRIKTYKNIDAWYYYLLRI